MKHSRFARLGLALPLILCGSAALGQGSLTPPPGPPGPTMKTLAQIEPRTPISALPFTVQAAGSYYLTTNLTGTAGAHGIVLGASDVTVDLNGFALSGGPGALNGISVPTAQTNITVRNGTLRGWTVGADASLGSQCRFERLRSIENTGPGLMAGGASVIEACAVFANRGVGLSVGPSSSIKDVSAQSNQLEGIRADTGTSVTGCTTSANLGDGLVLSNQCVVSGLVSLNNGKAGVTSAADTEVRASKAMGNGASGFALGPNALVSGCAASGNLESGIAAGAGAQVIDCRVVANSSGIVAQAGSSIRGCAASQNSGDGIAVTGESSVIGNHCNGNFLARDAAGIHLSGTDNVVKENTLLANDWGLRVDAAGNFIVNNRAANNTLDYFISATPQAMGPIVPSATFEAVSPFANFQF